ncbi:MAG TPA: BON domain-containing protein, partial [Anaeromyxobacteraceae bacterium]|nr:BON domain-containing protein [Anaeromyxobacteraceae bacterium]
MARYGGWDEWDREGSAERWRSERGDRPPEWGSGGRESERWDRDETDWRGDVTRRRAMPRGERWEDDSWRYRQTWPRDERDERFGRAGGDWRGRRPEIDPPWVERGPEARTRGESRGLVEWEDRGPLEWLGDKLGGRERRGRGPKGYRRSDDRIHDEVCERIARAGVDADEVEVKVEKGEVTLTGTVRDRSDKWRLEDVADDVFGVEDVNNQLRVRR